jgi:hypothetical protein
MAPDMNSPGAEQGQGPPFQPAAVPDPATSYSIPWHIAQQLVREIEDHFPLVAENVPDGGAALRLLGLQLLIERLHATLGALRQICEEQHRWIAARTAELLEANTRLRKEIADGAQAKRHRGPRQPPARRRYRR